MIIGAVLAARGSVVPWQPAEAASFKRETPLSNSCATDAGLALPGEDDARLKKDIQKAVLQVQTTTTLPQNSAAL